MDKTWIEKMYGSVLGKIIGVRLGIDYEFHYTSAEIQQMLPYVQTYHQSGNVTFPDDDTSGFVFFAKIFEKIDQLDSLTPELVADVILNYAAENRGFFWWDNSTESKSFHNLLHGVSPAEAGDYAHIGRSADMIGGQIFYDAIGLIFAGYPEDAATAARIVSGVLHNGEGKLGGQFICACIAAAFNESDIKRVVDTALSLLPPDTHYANMIRNIQEIYRKNPYDWHLCMHYIDDYYNDHDIWDYAAHVVMALLYGKSEFGYSMQICLQSAGDTDCNCGNVGAILGALSGCRGISYENWIKPLHDRFYVSGTIPFENDVSITRFTAKLICLHCKLYGKHVPEYLRNAALDTKYAFAFPYSYQGMEAAMWRDDKERSDLVSTKGSLWVCSGETAPPPSGNLYTLKLWADAVKKGDCIRIYRWFFGERDFGEHRIYEPTSCTPLFGGMRISTQLYTRYNQSNMHVRFVAYSSAQDTDRFSDEITLKPHTWTPISFRLPDIGTPYDCINLQIVPERDSWFENGYDGLDIYMDSLSIDGSADYKISYAVNRSAVDHRFHYPVLPQFSVCYGEARWMHSGGVYFYPGYFWQYQELAEFKGLTMAFTGTPMCSGTVKCKMSVLPAEEYGQTVDRSHASSLLLLGANGAADHYAVGFHHGKIAILRSGALPGDYVILAEAEFDYDVHQIYRFRADIHPGMILFTVYREDHSEPVSIHAELAAVPDGCIGFASLRSGITVYSYRVKQEQTDTL